MLTEEHEIDKSVDEALLEDETAGLFVKLHEVRIYEAASERPASPLGRLTRYGNAEPSDGFR